MLELKCTHSLLKHLAGQRSNGFCRPGSYRFTDPPKRTAQRIFAATLIQGLPRVIHEIVKVPVGKLLML
jgi:hypothetical protein